MYIEKCSWEEKPNPLIKHLWNAYKNLPWNIPLKKAPFLKRISFVSSPYDVKAKETKENL